MSAWRVAARLARREVRTHWARSLLVVVIIAVPVAAAQAVAIAWRSVDRSIDFASDDGVSPTYFPEHADAQDVTGFDPRLGEPPPIDGATQTAVGFRVQDWTSTPGHGAGPDDLSRVDIVGFVVDRSAVDLTEGREPGTRHEVVISTALADDAGLAVGDRMEAVASEVELVVVGIAGTDQVNGPTAWAGPPADAADDWVPAALARFRDSGNDQVEASMWQLTWFGASGGGVDGEPGDDLWVDDELAYASSSDVGLSDVVVGAVVAAIAIGFVATTASTAFAIGARRQMRQLGILASAGARPADLFRAVVLQGTVLGAVAAVAATVLTVTARSVVLRTVLDEGDWIVPRMTTLAVGIAVLGVVAGTVAAVVPALTASTVPTLSALAGRRPTRRRRLRTPWLGLVLVPVGLGLLTWAASDASTDSSSDSLASVVGVLATMVGAIALSPGIVAVIGTLSGRVGGTVRLAGRSLARSGMRTAAVVASTAVALSIPAIVLVAQAHDEATDRIDRTPAEEKVDEAYRSATIVRIEAPTDQGDAVLAQVSAIVGATGIATRTIPVLYDDRPISAISVDPERLRAVTGDDAVADALETGDLVQLEGRSRDADLGAYAPFGGREPGATIDGGDITTVAADDISLLTALLFADTSTGLVGLVPDGPSYAGGVVYVEGELPGSTQRELESLSAPLQVVPSRAALAELAPSDGRDLVSVWVDGPDPTTPPVALLTLAGSILLALIVVGTASALAAADGRDDERIVVAVGAPPTVVRQRRALEATLTALAATALGVGVGAVATVLVLRAGGSDAFGSPPPLTVPIVDLLGMTIASVVVIGGVTWLALSGAALVRGRRDVFLVD